jgi:3-isopropylmalate/(R)-2-methylmalate dehydratase small subunit
MQPFQSLHSRTVVLPFENIDTDQIIPARFLTTTQRQGLGKYAFHGWRYRADGSPQPEFILNRPEAAGCQILVAGDNFGCGSSREHAPWALLDCGIRAVISTRMADIFQNNALKNGLLPIVVHAETHRWLLAHPGVELTVNLQTCTLTLPTGQQVPFPLDRFARVCLLQGGDELGYLLEQAEPICQYEEMLSWMP